MTVDTVALQVDVEDETHGPVTVEWRAQEDPSAWAYRCELCGSQERPTCVHSRAAADYLAEVLLRLPQAATLHEPTDRCALLPWAAEVKPPSGRSGRARLVVLRRHGDPAVLVWWSPTRSQPWSCSVDGQSLVPDCEHAATAAEALVAQGVPGVGVC